MALMHTFSPALDTRGSNVHAVRRLLRARGMDPTDFDVDEDAHSVVSHLLGMPGGLLTLRRRSTGEMRVYACGNGSAWFAALSADLDSGYFKPPAMKTTRRAAARGLSFWMRGLSRAAGAAAR